MEMSNALQKNLMQLFPNKIIYSAELCKNICTRAEKCKVSLIKARYHFFVRALEGAYITLNTPKQLFLQRKLFTGNGSQQQAVFECAICTDCGRTAIVGKTMVVRLL